MVAFRWLKPKKHTGHIIVPDTVENARYEYNDQRLGHKYVGEVLLCGPKTTGIKPGDIFVIHEYNKVDQGTPWKEEDVLFCEDKDIIALIIGNKENKDITTFSKEITQEMEDHFGEDSDVEVSLKK